ncbi:diguanylate cyclase domain-containing protein [uncultured Robinsoniella sp.]|uniref:diguanylate cyclase domain-containing protein n=1 Tax=uncultured Robinsoniella sp. TaxID=904190 RepID=UPI00374F60DD
MRKEDICGKASQLIQQLMESYISGDQIKIEKMFRYLSPDILVIGTGKHEFYQEMESLICGLKKDQEEAKGIDFIIRNEWFEAKLVSEDVCIVYGEFEACESNVEGKQMVINMETRLTSVVHAEPDGRLIIDSLHHSVPYIYQQDGEYYPKTFASKAEEAMRRSAALEKDIQLDSMTGLFNRKYTERHISRLLEEEMSDGLLFLIDLDEFKRVNDQKGHQSGDALIKRTAAVLAEHARPSDIAGRVGGDEFMLFLKGFRSKDEGVQIASELINQVGRIFTVMDMKQSCSIGIVTIHKGEMSFSEAYKTADNALYKAKEAGRGTYFWHGNN